MPVFNFQRSNAGVGLLTFLTLTQHRPLSTMCGPFLRQPLGERIATNLMDFNTTLASCAAF